MSELLLVVAGGAGVLLIQWLVVPLIWRFRKPLYETKRDALLDLAADIEMRLDVERAGFARSQESINPSFDAKRAIGEWSEWVRGFEADLAKQRVKRWATRWTGAEQFAKLMQVIMAGIPQAKHQSHVEDIWELTFKEVERLLRGIRAEIALVEGVIVKHE